MNNSKEKSFAYDLIYYTISHIMPILIGLIMVPIYTGKFTTEEYGIYSLIISTVSVAGILSVSWINTSFSRFYNHRRAENKTSELAFVSIVLMMVMTFVLSLVFYLLSTWGMLSQIVPKQYFKGFMTLLFITNLYSFSYNYLRVIRKVRLSTVLSGLYVILRFAIFVLMVFYFNMTIYGFLIADALSQMIFIIAVLYRERGVLGSRIRFSVDKNFLREYLTYGLPFIFIQGVHWILTLSDRYMLQFIKGSSEVGIYSVNYSFTDRIIMPIITIFMNTAEPIVFQKFARESLEEADKALNKIFKYFLALAVPAALGLSMTAKEFSSIFIKNEFQKGYGIIPVISFGILFLGIRQYTNKGLEVAKKSKNIAYLSFIAAAVNILLNLMLIPKFGYMGAAYATLAAYAVYCIVSYYRLNSLSTIKVKFDRVHYNIMISAVVMALFVKSVDLLSIANPVLVLTIKVVTGIVVYSLLIIVFKVFEGEFNAIIKVLKGKLRRKTGRTD